MEHLSDAPVRHKTLLIRIVTFSWLNKKTIAEIISLFFVVLFLYTGISKLLEFDVFKGQLEESPVLGPVSGVIAWGLPIAEFIVSLLLFFPAYRLKGLYATFVLMVVFTSYVVALLTTSTELPCSCGGILEKLSWKGHLLFNSSSIILSFVALRIEKNKAQ